MTVQATRCDHCQRPVRETLHRRHGARVDFYRSVTGVPRLEVVEDPRREGRLVRSVRLEQVQEIMTCSDCWQKPDVQASLEEARRSGALPRA